MLWNKLNGVRDDLEWWARLIGWRFVHVCLFARLFSISPKDTLTFMASSCKRMAKRRSRFEHDDIFSSFLTPTIPNGSTFEYARLKESPRLAGRACAFACPLRTFELHLVNCCVANQLTLTKATPMPIETFQAVMVQMWQLWDSLVQLQAFQASEIDIKITLDLWSAIAVAKMKVAPTVTTNDLNSRYNPQSPERLESPL